VNIPLSTVGHVPKTQSLIEWQDDDRNGHLGYVAKVTPDETIIVQELGVSLPGVLHEQQMTAGEWRMYNPVFISVT
jgi:surface antigen